jgi:CRP-like cAMP-binding protein
MVKESDFFIFKGLDDAMLAKLASISVKNSCQNGEIVFYEKDEPKYLYLLVSGGIRVYKTTPKGQEIILHDIYAPSLVAEMANFENIPFPATAKTIMDSEVVKIDFEKFSSELLSNKAVALIIIKSLSGKIKWLEGFIDKEFTKTAEAKVAMLIVESPEIFKLTKHNNIAKILNITPETLSRTLTKLKNDEIISIDEKKICVRNDTALRKIYENEWV